MAITIIKAGILDSLQNGGRYGYASTGINPGGVMDTFAAKAANYLVGNPGGEAVAELHFPAAQILFNHDALIAVCGADFSPAIDGEAIPNWQPVLVKRNALLHFQKWRWGSRAYLAVHGGFTADKWLNSYSTHLKAGAGGYKGRALAKDDVLEINSSSINLGKLVHEKEDIRVLHWGIQHQDIYERPNEMLMLPGPEWDLLDDASKKKLTHSTFIIAPKSDRMGYLLNGDALQLHQQYEMISSGVDFGTIQLLAGGQLMILMADHQTTGGYPRAGNVTGIHLPKLAQLRPGDEVRFRMTDINTAEQLLLSQLRELKIIERSCIGHLNQLYARH